MAYLRQLISAGGNLAIDPKDRGSVTVGTSFGWLVLIDADSLAVTVYNPAAYTSPDLLGSYLLPSLYDFDANVWQRNGVREANYASVAGVHEIVSVAVLSDDPALEDEVLVMIAMREGTVIFCEVHRGVQQGWTQLHTQPDPEEAGHIADLLAVPSDQCIWLYDEGRLEFVRVEGANMIVYNAKDALEGIRKEDMEFNMVLAPRFLVEELVGELAGELVVEPRVLVTAIVRKPLSVDTSEIRDSVRIYAMLLAPHGDDGKPNVQLLPLNLANVPDHYSTIVLPGQSRFIVVRSGKYRVYYMGEATSTEGDGRVLRFFQPMLTCIEITATSAVYYRALEGICWFRTHH